MTSIKIWADAMLQGIAIAAPFILSAVPGTRKRATRKGWRLWLAIALLLMIIFSPFSFVGTTLDYVVGGLLASTIVASVFSRMVPPERTIIPCVVLGILTMVVYIPGKALFGSRPVDTRAQKEMVFTLRETPDMVAASQYEMQVDRRWLILEQRLWRSTVRPYCNSYSFDEDRQLLIATDTCNGPSLPH